MLALYANINGSCLIARVSHHTRIAVDCRAVIMDACSTWHTLEAETRLMWQPSVLWMENVCITRTALPRCVLSSVHGLGKRLVLVLSLSPTDDPSVYCTLPPRTI